MSNNMVVVETGSDAIGSVIWLHGLGADGHDFEPVVRELMLPDSVPLRFIFPHAPERPVTVNGGMVMRAWYDIKSLDAEGRADDAGIRESSAIVDALIADEVERGIPESAILLAGFSQGGAIAIHNALSRTSRPAGLMALSTYFALPNEPYERRSDDIPAFVAHGTFDPMVSIAAGQNCASRLEGHGCAVDWHEYPMAHGVCAAEIADIRDWLLRIYSA